MKYRGGGGRETERRHRKRPRGQGEDGRWTLYYPEARKS